MLPPQDELNDFTNGTNGTYDRSLAADLRGPHGDRGRNGGALVPMGYEQAEMPPVPWSAPPLPSRPPALTAAPSVISLLSALKRRMWLGLSLGLVMAAISATIPWFLMPAKREVATFLQVFQAQPSVMFPERAGPDEFATFKREQAAMITNPYVLNVALRDVNIAKLPMVVAAGTDGPEQVNYLAKNVSATYPGDATLMRISMWGEDELQLKQLIDAIREAYLKEVVNKEQQQRQARFTKLQDMLRSNRADIKQMQEKIQTLATETGSPDSEVVKRKIERMDRDLLTTHEEVIVAERHANDLEMQVALSAARLKQAQEENPIVTEAMVEDYLSANQEYVAVQQQLMHAQQIYDERRSRGGPETKALAAQRQKIEQMKEEIAQRRAQARSELLVAIREENILNTSQELARYRTEAELRRQHVQRTKAKLDKLQADAQTLSKRSFDLQQQISVLKELEDVTNKIAAEYQKLRIELDSPPRVIPLDKAAPQGDNTVTRYFVVGFCGLLGMVLTLVIVALIEFNARRIGDTTEVTEGLGLKVIGVLPHLSSRGLSKMVGKGNTIRGMLAESIDGIRSAVLHSERTDALRVVLATSALGHEGKTTVATQLAASLARAGRRTLLVDGDLRNPTAHRLLEQPLEPGLSEVLRGEVELDDAIRPTRAAGLWMIPAGKVCRECVHALAKDSMRLLFAKMRREFDFIVVDSAPVLSTADTLSLGQHADAAVLSVLRGVSRAAKVYEACDRLESVGIPVLGAVVNGVDTPLVRRLPGEKPAAGAPAADEAPAKKKAVAKKKAAAKKAKV